MENKQEYTVYSWLFLEMFNKLRMNGCNKVVTYLETEDGEKHTFSSCTIENEKEFISSFS